jgi:hypothetical protein
MRRPDFLSPLHQYAPLDPFPAAGSEQSPDPLLLLNPNKTAMLVDQFRFAGNRPNSVLANWDWLYLSVDLRLGSIPLTNGLVPVPAIVPRYFGFPGAGSISDTVLTWHLPRPLYVPPGVQLYARFTRQDVFATGNRATSITNTGFSVVGRSMPSDYPIPAKIWTPWVTATQCKQQPNQDDITRFVSTDQELANPNTELLHVTSLNGFNCGRLQGGLSHPTLSPLTAQMTLSSGKMLMRDPTDFFGLFPTDRGSLNLDAVLQSKEFVRAELELSPPSGAPSEESTIAYTTIGMIGYREVQTPIGVQP